MRMGILGGAVMLLGAVVLIGTLPGRGALAAGAAADLRRATFELRNELKVTIPDGARRVRVWFALPQDTDSAQQVIDLKVDAPYPTRIERDSEGSRVLYLEVENPREKQLVVATIALVTRTEVRSGVDPGKARPLTDADRVRFARYLQPNKHVVVDDEIRKLADQIVGPETNPVLAARKLYDWVIDNVDYWVKDPKNKKASPVGSTTYCLTFRTGNCTDFQSLWASLARAKGIPTQIVYGSFLKPELRAQDQDQSYHCWAEFYAPGLGWIVTTCRRPLYAGEYPITEENRRLVRLTSADGTFGAPRRR